MTDDGVLNDNPEEQDLLLRLAALPSEAEPARDLWPAIAVRIAGSDNGTSAHPLHPTRPPYRRRFLIQAAAAVLLFAAGIAVGRYGEQPEPVVASPIRPLQSAQTFRPFPSAAPAVQGGNTAAVVTTVAGRCPEGHPESGDLGIGSLLCISGSCTINLRTSRDLRESSPAAGKLQGGDILLTIDGVLITSREGSRRMANLKPGRPVTLRIRRAGREIDVVLVPRLGCSMPTLGREGQPEGGRHD